MRYVMRFFSCRVLLSLAEETPSVKRVVNSIFVSH